MGTGSDNLNYLRKLPARLRETHRVYAQQLKNIKDSSLMDDATKKMRMEQLAAAQQELLSVWRAEANAKSAAIRESAGKGAVAPTPEAKAQIQRALDKPGVTWQEVARLCVAQNDRAGLAALREQLPWQSIGSNLGGAARPDRQLKHDLQTLDAMERPLMSEPEQRAKEELRELDACNGANEQNFSDLHDYYHAGQQPLNMGHQLEVQKLYNWVGIPGEDGKTSNVGATSMTLPVTDPTPMGYDVMSRTMRPLTEPAQP